MSTGNALRCVKAGSHSCLHHQQLLSPCLPVRVNCTLKLNCFGHIYIVYHSAKTRESLVRGSRGEMLQWDYGMCYTMANAWRVWSLAGSAIERLLDHEGTSSFNWLICRWVHIKSMTWRKGARAISFKVLASLSFLCFRETEHWEAFLYHILELCCFLTTGPRAMTMAAHTLKTLRLWTSQKSFCF